MKKIISLSGFSIISHLLKWTALALPLSFLTGSLVAFFLWALDELTTFRENNNWLLLLLPVAGLLIYFLYKYAGKNAQAGNNLILDEIHEPGHNVPVRMAPLVLFTTLLTHLCGGSAGREGTAVQMGGSMASLLARWFFLTKEDLKMILTMGIAAGFGAVFGTPVAGAIFAMEVLIAGNINYRALLPCLMASVLADITCSAWQIDHTRYIIKINDTMNFPWNFIPLDLGLLLKVIIAGVIFGMVSHLFIFCSGRVKFYSSKWIRKEWMIPLVGGGLIIVLTWMLGTTDYLGLGVTSNNPNAVTILSSFNEGGAGYFSWGWKLIFTVITLGMGFKGGEVTPLFFIGAALGNMLAIIMGLPVDLMAGLGFIAVFAGATNTPVACTIMGVELFGAEYLLYYAIACFTAYYFSGSAGIYHSQRRLDKIT